MITVRVSGEAGLRRMARAVADGPDHIRDNLGVAVRRATRPTLRDAKRAIQTNRVVGYRAGGRRYRGPNTPKGLRQAIANAVDAEVNVGTLNPRVRFVVRTYQLGDRRKLPEYIESGDRWRHPILGNRKAWASQSGKPWFEKSVQKNLPLFERRVNEAVNRAARAIERNA
jgi:hypothetical protein